jgi:hypothetical protein
VEQKTERTENREQRTERERERERERAQQNREMAGVLRMHSADDVLLFECLVLGVDRLHLGFQFFLVLFQLLLQLLGGHRRELTEANNQAAKGPQNEGGE